MEQLTHIYDSTVGESFFNLEQEETVLNQYEVFQLMQQLMSSIDLHKLTSLYFKQLQSKLNLSAVKIKFTNGCLTLGEPTDTCNTRTIDFSNRHTVYATVTYCFPNILTLKENSILRELHKYFKSPLKNALEHHTLKQLAMKDHLTSLGNRANYQETLHRLVSQAKRHNNSFGILVIDMDKFKSINDNFGHQEGDKVLIATAEILQSSLRDTDYAFRFGGDEFCCLLTASFAQDNAAVAKRIQQAMSKHPTLVKHAISCSIGSANYQVDDTEQSLFERADKALYQAKNSGRSCVKAA